MTNTKQTIEKLYALDEARARGEWRVHEHKHGEGYGISDINWSVWCHTNMFTYKADGSIVDASQQGFIPIASIQTPMLKGLPDANFIAAAPTMMQVIRKQQELLAVAREALEITHGVLYPYKAITNTNAPITSPIEIAFDAVDEALKQLSEAIDG